MKDIFLLIKIMLINGLRPDKKKKDGSIIAIYIALGISYLSILAMGITTIATVTPIVAQNNLLAEFVTMIYLAGTSLVVIFGIISLLTYVYFNKDAEFMASLPVKPGKVFLAKLTIVYLYEFVIFAAAVIPMLITVGIVASQGVVFYLSSLLGVLIVPALPLAISSVIAIPLMNVVSFFRNKGVFTTIFLLVIYSVIFGAYIFGISSLQQGASKIGENFNSIIDNITTVTQIISKIFYPVYAISCLATGKALYGLGVPLSGLVNLAISLASIFILLLIAYFISNAVYHQSTIRQNESAKSSNSKIEKSEFRSQLKALMIKELKDITRTSAFGFQCLAGIIILPLLLFGMSFSISNIEGVEQSQELIRNIYYAVSFGMLLMLGSGMNITSSTAISREGKNFYMLKIIPVDYETQINAKVYLSLIINYIAIFVGYLVSIFVFKLGVIEIIFFPIALALYSYGYAYATIRFDLKAPKLNWTTPNEAVKNNQRAVIPTLVNMAVCFVIMGGLATMYGFLGTTSGMVNIPGYAVILIKIGVWLILTLGFLAFAIVSRNRLYGSLNALYEKIEV
ncbi:MAG TPA: hypothetical protein VIL03_02570 [Clostridia bacterium]